MSYKTKKNLSTVVQVIVTVLLIALIFAGIQAVIGLFEVRDGYYNAKLNFSLGNVVSDSTGKGVIEEDNTMLYSDALVCTGFRITPAGNPRYEVTVHFFTEDNRYIGYKSFANHNYELKVGEMPYLKNVIGDIGSDDYDSAPYVVEGGELVQAHHVRIVINPLDNEDDIFTRGWFGFVGMVTRNRFINSLDIEYTDAPITEDAVPAPTVPESTDGAISI